MEQIKLTFEQVKELLPDRVSLNYIDYRDSLDEHTELLSECVKQNSLDTLYDEVMDWFIDSEWESVQYIINELKSDIQNKYDIEDAELDDIMDEYEDLLRDEIYNRDDSTPLDDLLRNTNDLIMFYDTGLEFDGWGKTPAEFRMDRIRIKKMLSITNSDYDNDIDMMLQQAGYGGQLVIYFRMNVKDIITDKDFNTIQFDNAQIAIIDTYNGSGDDCNISGHSFELPFDRSNLFVEKEVHYNYTYDVCGMVNDWCDSTGVSFLERETECELNKSPINAHMDQERKYNEVYENGGCSFGDMNYSRHRNTYYINNYPCGNKCKDCGTFWID